MNNIYLWTVEVKNAEEETPIFVGVIGHYKSRLRIPCLECKLHIVFFLRNYPRRKSGSESEN